METEMTTVKIQFVVQCTNRIWILNDRNNLLMQTNKPIFNIAY